MTQDVGHIFQCRAIANHLARRRMAEAVAAQAPSVQSNTLEKTAGDPSGRRGFGERLMGRTSREKHFPMRAAWPLMLDVLGKDSTHITGQRESPFAVSLRTPDMNHAFVPIDVLQTELARFAAAKSQPGEEQDEGTLAPCSAQGDWQAASTFSSSSAERGRGRVASYQRRTRGMALTNEAEICPSVTRKRR